MNPSFRQILDLFEVPSQEEAESKAARAKKTGDSAEESEALGRACLNDGDYEAAIKHFRRAVEQVGEGKPEVLENLGGAYEAAEMIPQALRQYEKAKRLHQTADLQIGLSELYRRSGRRREALEKLEEGIRLEPENAFVHYKLAESLRDLGEYRHAVLAVQGAIHVAPDQWFYHYWMADLLIEMKRFDEAVDAIRAAIELSPGDDHLFQRAAIALWGAKRPAEAIQAIRLASDLEPEKQVYRGVLERFLRWNGLAEEADQEAGPLSDMDAYDLDLLDRMLAPVSA